MGRPIKNATPRVCPQCMGTYTPKERKQIYCSKPCALRAFSAKHHDKSWGNKPCK